MAATEPLDDILFSKIKVLNETTWEFRVPRPKINRWLANFDDDKERTHVLFLLSQFMYFGSLQIRELLKCLYRDLFKYPIIEGIRLKNAGSTNVKLLESMFGAAEGTSRFLGVGNPSESGTHLLYFFRQENKLSKTLFINTHEIFKKSSSGVTELADPTIKNYVFIDDFCGSGSQATIYSENIVKDIKSLDPTAQISYLMLFSTSFGKNEVKKNTNFDYVETVVELDDSFKCFDPASRYFHHAPTEIDKDYLQQVCEKHGDMLMRDICELSGLTDPVLSVVADENKLGFGDSQLLIGFHHNTPDNSLPIIWYDEENINWYPVFKRYNKKYGI
jgi:hypothetical protein